ncbi:chorion peroxidase-like [Tachypleus tridentatus]|uniref:chorion peroxidase-like n=1 Tax=Tachypleus tridentatus TaxID=6853 RepID=UPI003FD1C411
MFFWIYPPDPVKCPNLCHMFISREESKVEDIDLFSAGVNERPPRGGIVGPTFGCIIGIQIGLLKFGDRYYFEHENQSGSFTPDQLREIRKTTLSRILCDNSDGFQNISRLPFRPENYEGNEVVYCNDLPEINLEPWS